VRRSKVFVAIFVVIVLITRWIFPERPLDYTGPRAVLDSLFALNLLFLTTLLAIGIGLKALQKLKLDGLDYHEQVLFGLPLGIGIIAYGILALGLLGALQPWPILIWLIVLGVYSHNEWGTFLDNILPALGRARLAWRDEGAEKKLLLVAIGVILLLTLGQSLSPPTDPDGLIHHLQEPKLFLEAGRFFASSDFVFANYPSTMESMFLVGMAFGSDTYAKLFHLLTATLLVIATYALGRRLHGSGTGWKGVLVLLGMPIIPVWASLAYIDMGWALFEFLAVYAILIWHKHDSRNFLTLSGLMIGLALTSKYLAFEGAAALGLWLLWSSRHKGLRTTINSAVLFGCVALLAASPWYIKNWAALGDPIYPYLSGDSGTLIYNKPLGILDYLLLPLSLYIHRELFVGVYGSIEFPSIFFPLVLLYPFTRRTKLWNGLAGLTLLRYAFWAVISHWRFRYLLPALPGLSLLASSVITDLAKRPIFRMWRGVLFRGLLAGMLLGTMTYSMLFFMEVQPWRVGLGFESKESFLRREVPDYEAKEFIQSNLPPDARVLMPWNLRTYYCDDRCVPDYLRRMWVDLTIPATSPASVAVKLHELKITHLLLSAKDVDYSIIIDDSGLNESALQFLMNDFRPACTREIYDDDLATLLEVICK
jgi:hypothetical protein